MRKTVRMTIKNYFVLKTPQYLGPALVQLLYLSNTTSPPKKSGKYIIREENHRNRKSPLCSIVFCNDRIAKRSIKNVLFVF